MELRDIRLFLRLTMLITLLGIIAAIGVELKF